MKSTRWIPVYGLLTMILLGGGCSKRQVEERLAENELATNTLHTDVQALEQRVLSMEGRLTALSSDVGSLEVKTRKGARTAYVVTPAPKATPVAMSAVQHSAQTTAQTTAQHSAQTTAQTTPYVPLAADAQAAARPAYVAPAVTATPTSAGLPPATVPTGLALSLPPTAAPSPVQTAPASAPPPVQTAPKSTPRPASNITPAPTAAATPIPAQSAVSLALPPESSSAVFGQPAAAVASTEAPTAPAVTATPVISQSAASAAAVSLAPLTPKVKGEEGAYNAALALARGGQTAEAINRFMAFLQDYPTGRYAPNAYYWIGECLYAQRKYADALLQFKDVAARYPRHHKTADALLKAGMTYDRLGDKENAALQYRALVTDFPNSEAARRVKGRGAAR